MLSPESFRHDKTKSIREAHTLFESCIGENDCEFLTSVSTWYVEPAHCLFYKGRYVAEYDISDLMTVGVIDCLKMIQSLA